MMARRYKKILGVCSFLCILLTALFLRSVVIYLSGLHGTVLSSETNKPIADAYVICFSNKYPLLEKINVGGPNSKPHAIDVVRTNNQGEFKLPRYLAVSIRFKDLRNIIIFKPGFLSCRYTQSTNSYLHDMISDRKINIEQRNIFYLENASIQKEDPEPLNALGKASSFAVLMKMDDKDRYETYKPALITLRDLFEKHPPLYLSDDHQHIWDSLIERLNNNL